MEYYTQKENENSLWASSSPQSHMGVDSESMNTAEDQLMTISDLMSLDSYGGWCNSPSINEHFLSPYVYTSLLSINSNYTSNFAEQGSSSLPMNENGSNTLNLYGSPLSCVERMGFSHNDSCSEQENIFTIPHDEIQIPSPLGQSLPQRMLRALSQFKESSGGGILAQVWVPIKVGDQYMLSTCEQPYLLDQMLLGYREVSRSYTFSAEQKPGCFPGVPGRVFISRMPEWTSNVSYYNSAEYIRVKHALDHEVRGSVALPIINPESSCCAVLELVTVREKTNFDSEIDSVCRALEAVDLRTIKPPRLLPQCLTADQRTALAEIKDVLRAVCHAHILPLALTWIPCTLEEDDGHKIFKICVKDNSINLNQKSVLCVEENACYVNDKEMQEFVHACAEHFLEEGQGVAGKALQSNIPFFFPDVKNYHISDYPLVQHARKFGLSAAVAIRLRSTYTGIDDYILELFLPPNNKGNKEQQLLLDSLSSTMQRLCRSLRTVTDAELVGSLDPRGELCGVSESLFPTDLGFVNASLFGQNQLDGTKHICVDRRGITRDPIKDDNHFNEVCGSSKSMERKRSTTEKTVSLSVLQQYFSGSLKDAAKSIGVCPTTLKRICRQHGISRWPSRKINKVNRSLRKIQTVLDSVEGVEGRLKFDPTTGELVATSTIIQDLDPTTPKMCAPNKQNDVYFPFSTCLNGENSEFKFENESDVVKNRTVQGATFLVSDSHKQESNKSSVSGDFGHNQASSSGMTDSSIASGSMSSSPSSLNRHKYSKDDRMSNDDSRSQITIKATYKDDTVRFKFEPSSGCLHLYEEVAKRFKIQIGTFQLKYLDDEDEWVMMVGESDLHECLEIMDYLGKNSIKFLVRDLGFGMGSSGGSNCFLPGSCLVI